MLKIRRLQTAAYVSVRISGGSSYIDPGKSHQNAFFQRFNGSLLNKLMTEGVVDSLDYVRRKLVLSRNEYHVVRPLLFVGKQTGPVPFLWTYLTSVPVFCEQCSP